MRLVEQHIIRNTEWRDWCVKAKNLYNQALYYWRQSVFGKIEYFSEYELTTLFAEFDEENYRSLPANSSQQIVKTLFKNIKAWQKALKLYAKNPGIFLAKPKPPKYKKELSQLHFSNASVKLKNGYIHFPKMVGIAPMKTNIPNINHCRVIPKNDHFVVEFVYTVEEVELKPDNGKYMGVDLGLNNLATCSTNTGESFIINGKIPKSINQWWNKQKAYLQAKLPNKRHTSKRIKKLTFNRNNKIENYIHHASKFIVSKAEELDINTIIIGNNKQWKTEVNLGKTNNQNFVSLPYLKLIDQTEYKARLKGINVEITEESYTSKCSALDLETICKHETYVGKRKKRGLFVTATGKLINADANGSLNIIRKKYPLIVSEEVVSAVVAPKKIKHFNKVDNNIKYFIQNKQK